MLRPVPYEPPSWAGKPPVGLHLDVLKDGKLIQKLMIDEKTFYLFGRNRDVVDFCTDHGSCSRVHSALLWHKHLNRCFLVDLGSTHGTFLGTIRLEPHKPQQVPLDSTLTFGASTRAYIIRERPQAKPKSLAEDSDEVEGGLLGLPETETELDNLTEFNTAHNRRVTTFGIPDSEGEMVRTKRGKKKLVHVSFSLDEEIINPEDIDPSVGRFRNMVSTAFIPNKKMRSDSQAPITHAEQAARRLQPHLHANEDLYGNMPHPNEGVSPFATALPGKLGFALPNPAPDVERTDIKPPPVVTAPVKLVPPGMEDEPQKKKYAKEAWPGKRPTHSLLV